jgi:hypothetical protein
VEPGHDVRWWHLVLSIGVASGGLYYGITVKLSKYGAEDDRTGLVYGLKLYAKVGGWIVGVAGIMATIRLIEMLTGINW